MKIYCENIPNIPWQEKPADCNSVMWRHDTNPILDNKTVYRADRVYNSAAVPFNGGFAGVFRVDDDCKCPKLRVGFSEDGVNWKINDNVIEFENDTDDVIGVYGYDPRVCYMEGKYYVTWCNSTPHGAYVAIAYTTDFEKFYFVSNALMPQNRNGVLFPRKINGKYYLLSRPCDKGHNQSGDIFISCSPDLKYWGEHKFLIGSAPGWAAGKVGAGPVPIETEEGWLLIFHGTNVSCNGYIYSFGAALLDREEPTKVLYRAKPFLIAPEEDYERNGEVDNVTFPCAALCDAETGRLALYYGGADTVLCLAYSNVNDIVEWVKERDFRNE